MRFGTAHARALRGLVEAGGFEVDPKVVQALRALGPLATDDEIAAELNRLYRVRLNEHKRDRQRARGKR